MEVARYAPPYFASSSLASSPFDFSLLLPSFSSPSFEVNIYTHSINSTPSRNGGVRFMVHKVYYTEIPFHHLFCS